MRFTPANEFSRPNPSKSRFGTRSYVHFAASRGYLEPGDADEGLNAAAAIGDDRLQRMARGQVIPETFTHGSSADRVRWLRRGLDGGTIESCDTFSSGTN